MGRIAFERRLVRMPAGCERPYDESEWEDELVIVVCGMIELEGLSGRRWCFRRGAVIWLTDLPLRSLHNPTDEVTVLMTVADRLIPDPRIVLSDMTEMKTDNRWLALVILCTGMLMI